MNNCDYVMHMQTETPTFIVCPNTDMDAAGAPLTIQHHYTTLQCGSSGRPSNCLIRHAAIDIQDNLLGIGFYGIQFLAQQGEIYVGNATQARFLECTFRDTLCPSETVKRRAPLVSAGDLKVEQCVFRGNLGSGAVLVLDQSASIVGSQFLYNRAEPWNLTASAIQIGTKGSHSAATVSLRRNCFDNNMGKSIVATASIDNVQSVVNRMNAVSDDNSIPAECEGVNLGGAGWCDQFAYLNTTCAQLHTVSPTHAPTFTPRPVPPTPVPSRTPSGSPNQLGTSSESATLPTLGPTKGSSILSLIGGLGAATPKPVTASTTPRPSAIVQEGAQAAPDGSLLGLIDGLGNATPSPATPPAPVVTKEGTRSPDGSLSGLIDELGNATPSPAASTPASQAPSAIIQEGAQTTPNGSLSGLIHQLGNGTPSPTPAAVEKRSQSPDGSLLGLIDSFGNAVPFPAALPTQGPSATVGVSGLIHGLGIATPLPGVTPTQGPTTAAEAVLGLIDSLGNAAPTPGVTPTQEPTSKSTDASLIGLLDGLSGSGAPVPSAPGGSVNTGTKDPSLSGLISGLGGDGAPTPVPSTIVVEQGSQGGDPISNSTISSAGKTESQDPLGAAIATLTNNEKVSTGLPAASNASMTRFWLATLVSLGVLFLYY
jgi:hypothetical protein